MIEALGTKPSAKLREKSRRHACHILANGAAFFLCFFGFPAASPNLTAQESGPSLKVKLRLDPGTQCVAHMRYPALERWKARDPRAARMKMSPSPIKRIFTFSGADLSRRVEFSDRSVFDEFVRGKYYLALSSESGISIIEIGSEDDPGNLDFRGSHFPELAWVDESDNRGLRKIKGIEYLVYEEEGTSPALTRRLYVNPVTLYPALYESYDEVASYSYQPFPAAGKIALPEKLGQAWEKVKADTKRYFKYEIQE